MIEFGVNESEVNVGSTFTVVMNVNATDMINSVPDEKKEEYLKNIPMKSFGKVSDIANAVCDLCGDSFRYMTGQVIVMDGGLSL